MPVYLLEKTFTHGKDYTTKERSEKLKLPKGIIICWSNKAEANSADNIRWWIEIDGHKAFPHVHTNAHWGPWNKVNLGCVHDLYVLPRHGMDVELVGFNVHVSDDFWIQVFVSVITDVELDVLLKR